MSFSTTEVPSKSKLPEPRESSAPLVAPWFAFPAAGFLFAAGGFRLTTDEVRLYESMNIELPLVLQWQVDGGRALGVALIAVGIAFALLTRIEIRRPRAPTWRTVRLAAATASAFAVFGAIGIFRSGEIIFQKLQVAYQQ